MSPLFDTHAHLHDPAFDADRAAVWRRALDAGVTAAVTVGTDWPTSAAAVELARATPGLYASVGLHPHDASLWSADLEAQFRALAQVNDAVAIGEIGLDFYRNLSPPDAQELAFAAQLGLADSLQLPVIVHSRNADVQVYAALDGWAAAARLPHPLGVLHCFSGDAGLARTYSEIGFLISFAGPVTYPQNAELREAARLLPAEAIVVETDCPYLAPQSRRGRRNEPALIAETARYLAELRGETPAAFAAQTSANARRLFRIPEPARMDA